MAEPCPLITVSGPPHARGVSYGQQAAGRIKRGIGHYAAQLRALDLEGAAVADLVREFVPAMDGFDPTYAEEMRGIAQGADVAFEDVALLNARTEILQLAARPELRAGLARQRGPGRLHRRRGAASGNARTARVIHAQNWDWKAECAETAVVLRIRREDGPDILTFTEAGGLARSGMNAAGVAITANYLESDRDYRQMGVPLALLRRKVLEQEHVALAMRAVYCTPKSASNNMIVSHAGGVAINFECAPDETFQVHAQDGLIVHANHWQSAVALGKLRDTGIAEHAGQPVPGPSGARPAGAAPWRDHGGDGEGGAGRRLRLALVGVPSATAEHDKQPVGNGRDGRDAARRRGDGGGDAAGAGRQFTRFSLAMEGAARAAAE